MKQRWLVACERSGTIRRALSQCGHWVVSVDLAPAEDGAVFGDPSTTIGSHYQGDILDFIYGDSANLMDAGFDGMIAHPDCTFLTVANTYMSRGCSKYTAAQAKDMREQAVEFFMQLANAPFKKICIENPIGIMSTRWRKPDQIVQPWYYGDDASKATCLWLKGLPLLRDSHRLPGDRSTVRANQTPSRQNKLGPSPERAMLRAKTYPGLADAIAQQWGGLT